MPRTPATTSAGKAKAAVVDITTGRHQTPDDQTAELAEATAAPTVVGDPDRLVDLPLEQLIPSPDNPRAAETDLKDLAASFRESGQLEPIVVTPLTHIREIGTNKVTPRYELVFGHRRLLAARLAGLPTLRAIIRADLTPRTIAVTRLVENLQRVDLTPLDEARALDQLRTAHGMTQAAISTAIGRNQGHVSKRLALLKLTPAATAILTTPTPADRTTGKPARPPITVEQAVDLSRLPDDLQDRAAHAIVAGDNPETALRRALADQRDRADRADAIADLKKAKVPFEETTLPTLDYSLAEGPSYVADLLAASRIKTIDAHRKAPCALTIVPPTCGLVRGAYTWVVDLCTDPASHKPPKQTAIDVPPAGTPAPTATDADADAKAAAAENAARRAQQARTDQARADTDRRTTWIRELITTGKLPATATTHVLRDRAITLTIGGRELDTAWMAQGSRLAEVATMLDLDHDLDLDTDNHAGATALAHLTATTTGDQLTRLALGATLLEGEDTTRGDLRGLAYRPDGPIEPTDVDPATHAHLTFLDAAGYPLSPQEQAVLDHLTLTDTLTATQRQYDLVETPDPEPDPDHDLDAPVAHLTGQTTITLPTPPDPTTRPALTDDQIPADQQPCTSCLATGTVGGTTCTLCGGRGYIAAT